MKGPDHHGKPIPRAAEAIDRLLTVDLATRGVVNVLYTAARRAQKDRPLCMVAAERLADVVNPGDTIVIATGLPIRGWFSSALAESDGPAGAATLARALYVGLSAVPVLVCEEPMVPLLQAACRAAGLVVTSSERTSLHAAYAWMKQIAARRTAAQIWLIHNRVQDRAVARHAQQRLALAADRFLNLDISLAGLLLGEQKRSYAEETPSCGLLSSPTGTFRQTLERLVVRWMGDERKRWPAVATVGEKSEKTESTQGHEPITSPSLFAPTVVKM